MAMQSRRLSRLPPHDHSASGATSAATASPIAASEAGITCSAADLDIAAGAQLAIDAPGGGVVGGEGELLGEGVGDRPKKKQ